MSSRANLVSVIVPCYNAEAFIEESIESALDQTHAPTEVVVVDDGSTDGSLEIIRSFGDRITWHAQENLGAPVARNRGLQMSSGPLVKFLDADDVLAEDVLARQMEEMQRLDDDRSVVFGDRRKKDARPFRKLPDKNASLEYLVGAGINTVCSLYRRELLTEVDGFAEGLPCGQEYDLHIRMKLDGTRFYYRPGVVLRTSHHTDDGISERTFAGRNPHPRMSLFRRIGTVLHEAFDGSVPASVRKPLARRWWITGRQALRGGHENEARQCFGEARALDSRSIVGSRFYRTSVRVLGPLMAERIGSWIKKNCLR